jgi:SSS family solute:Na+ symporter
VSLLAGPGFKGFVIAAVMGAVVSSLASMLNAASTIFTMDIFKRFLKPDATEHQQVLVGRICGARRGRIGLRDRPDLRRP